MADVKISGLPASTVPLAGTEVLPIVQGGATKQVSIANVTAGRAVSALSVTTDTNKAASSAGGALQANNGIVCLQWGAGGGSGLILDGGVSSTAANAALVFSPTGTGTVAISPAGALTINPTAASTINNTSIGATTASTGRFTSVTATTGNVVIGTSGQGIDFSATAGTGASELLADYEEGTWTPSQGAGLVVVGTFSSSGLYTKIGRQVTVKAVLSGSTSIAATASAILTSNLPFAPSGVFAGSAVNSNANGGSQVFASTDFYSISAIVASGAITLTATYFV